MAKQAVDVTHALERLREGDPKAHDELLPLVYDQLRALAASQFKGRAGHLLQPTALVHEAYMRLVGQGDGYQNRSHFMAVAATAMRQILIDYARREGSLKRGGDRARVSLADIGPVQAARDEVDILALSDVLDRLAALDARQARLVELRVFGGMAAPEAAEVLGVSLRTVEREWRAVKAWLQKELADFAGHVG